MKESLSLPNVANFISAHVAAKFPSLARVPIDGVWFTGSNVWSFVLGTDPRPESDWDIFVTGEDIAWAIVLRLGLLLVPACRTDQKRNGAEKIISAANVPRLSIVNGHDLEIVARHDGTRYGNSNGFCYATEAGEVDLWISLARDATEEIRSYPSDSHAHCRAAWSFTGGLIVLPNESAIPDDEWPREESVARPIRIESRHP